jgi:hypothetical protein
MEELVQVTTTAETIVDYEDLVDRYRELVEDIEEDTGREADPDEVIDEVIDVYFADNGLWGAIVPTEAVRNIKKKLKEILF